MAWPAAAMSRKTRGCEHHSATARAGQCSGRSAASISITRCWSSLTSAMSYRPLRDRRQPVAVLGRTAVHHVEEQRLQLFGDRAATAGADGAVVEFADRRHFGCSAGEEGFIGRIDLVARDALLDHGQADLASELDDGVARDALER